MRGFTDRSQQKIGARTFRQRVGFAVALLSLSLASACAFIPYAPQTVSLRVKGNVPDAQVTIDDLAIGALGFVSAHGVALEPGKHRVTVEKPGYFPWDAILVADDEPIYLDVKLVPIPD